MESPASWQKINAEIWPAVFPALTSSFKTVLRCDYLRSVRSSTQNNSPEN